MVASLWTVESENFIIEVHQSEPMNIKELVVFYLRAVERFRSHALAYAAGEDQLANESRARGALAEALSWADSIDQYLAKGPRDRMGSDRDPNWADSVDDASGDLVRAFQYARNHVHHHWLNLVGTRLRGGSVAPHEWFWADVPKVSRAGDGKRAGADEYEQRMLGAEVLSTLDLIAEIFWVKRTWEIRLSDIAQPGYQVGAVLEFDPDRDS